MKRCPFCAEEIQDAAIVCRFCQRDLPPAPAPAPREFYGIALDDSPASPPEPEPGVAKGHTGVALLWIAGILIVTFGAPYLIDALSGPNLRPATRASESPTVIRMSQYLRLSEGMSYREAVRVLGREGEEISRSDLAGTTTIMYQWHAGEGVGNMNAMFQNDKLVTKAQFGLR